jgi:hypothetical protein
MNTDSKDSTLMNTSSNLNMMIEATASDHEQYQSTNDTSSSVNNMISSLRFSKSVTIAVLDYIYPWMRPSIRKLIENR